MVDKTEIQQPTTVSCAGSRAELNIEGLRRTFREHLFYTQGRFPVAATKHDIYMALAYTVRDQMLHRWIKTVQQLTCISAWSLR